MIVKYTLCDKCDDKIAPDQVYSFDIFKAGNVITKKELQLCVNCTDAFRNWMKLDVHFKRKYES